MVWNDLLLEYEPQLADHLWKVFSSSGFFMMRYLPYKSTDSQIVFRDILCGKEYPDRFFPNSEYINWRIHERDEQKSEGSLGITPSKNPFAMLKQVWSDDVKAYNALCGLLRECGDIGQNLRLMHLQPQLTIEIRSLAPTMASSQGKSLNGMILDNLYAFRDFFTQTPFYLEIDMTKVVALQQKAYISGSLSETNDSV